MMWPFKKKKIARHVTKGGKFSIKLDSTKGLNSGDKLYNPRNSTTCMIASIDGDVVTLMPGLSGTFDGKPGDVAI